MGRRQRSTGCAQAPVERATALLRARKWHGMRTVHSSRGRYRKVAARLPVRAVSPFAACPMSQKLPVERGGEQASCRQDAAPTRPEDGSGPNGGCCALKTSGARQGRARPGVLGAAGQSPRICVQGRTPPAEPAPPSGSFLVTQALGQKPRPADSPARSDPLRAGGARGPGCPGMPRGVSEGFT
jgi:hypothetical protein